MPASKSMLIAVTVDDRSKESLAERFCGALAALAPASADCGATGAQMGLP